MASTLRTSTYVRSNWVCAKGTGHTAATWCGVFLFVAHVDQKYASVLQFPARLHKYCEELGRKLLLVAAVGIACMRCMVNYPQHLLWLCHADGYYHECHFPGNLAVHLSRVQTILWSSFALLPIPIVLQGNDWKKNPSPPKTFAPAKNSHSDSFS